LYAYGANNPVHYIDPDGRTNYILYDEDSFSKQAKAEAKRIPVTNNEDTIMISIKTEKEFKDAWNKMQDATDVSLFFHGSSKTLNIDWKEKEYLTTNKDGKTPLGNDALYIGDLDSKEIGCLRIYSCQGGNLKEPENVANCFDQNNTVGNIYATDGNLSFTRFSYKPKISHAGKSEYIRKYNQSPLGFIQIKK